MRGTALGRAPNDWVSLEQEGQVAQNELRETQQADWLQCDEGWR
jgi:hypothetical protein